MPATEAANMICITGYGQDSDCMCCGRALRHVIQTDAGSFGASCFIKRITRPQTYRGKPNRLSTDAVIYLAKRAHNPTRFQIPTAALIFETA